MGRRRGHKQRPDAAARTASAPSTHSDLPNPVLQRVLHACARHTRRVCRHWRFVHGPLDCGLLLTHVTSRHDLVALPRRLSSIRTLALAAPSEQPCPSPARAPDPTSLTAALPHTFPRLASLDLHADLLRTPSDHYPPPIDRHLAALAPLRPHLTALTLRHLQPSPSPPSPPPCPPSARSPSQASPSCIPSPPFTPRSPPSPPSPTCSTSNAAPSYPPPTPPPPSCPTWPPCPPPSPTSTSGSATSPQTTAPQPSSRSTPASRASSRSTWRWTSAARGPHAPSPWTPWPSPCLRGRPSPPSISTSRSRAPAPAASDSSTCPASATSGACKGRPPAVPCWRRSPLPFRAPPASPAWPSSAPRGATSRRRPGCGAPWPPPWCASRGSEDPPLRMVACLEQLTALQSLTMTDDFDRLDDWGAAGGQRAVDAILSLTRITHLDACASKQEVAAPLLAGISSLRALRQLHASAVDEARAMSQVASVSSSLTRLQLWCRKLQTTNYMNAARDLPCSVRHLALHNIQRWWGARAGDERDLLPLPRGVRVLEFVSQFPGTHLTIKVHDRLQKAARQQDCVFVVHAISERELVPGCNGYVCH